MQQIENSVGMPVSTQMRQLYRGVFSLDGSLGDDWSWKAYYEHSESRLHEVGSHVVISQNLTNAINAVTVTPANVGSSGLAIGSIACASTLTNPANGCVPLDIIGTGNESQAAINYIEDNHNFQEQVENQDVIDVSMQGILPWDLTGAGRPSVAFGADYRKEGANVAAAEEGVLQELIIGNFSPAQGHYYTYEGFVETDMPLLKDIFVDSLTLNAAGRVTDYSTSGAVETWKLGLVSQVNSDIRLRATWSYDIRAPNLSELDSGGVVTTGSPLDPRINTTVTGASTDTLSNPNLVPEKSTTVSGGVVLTPHWLEGLSLSFDWYSISVKDYIAAPSATLEAQLCEAGNQFYCSQFMYNSAGKLTEVLVAPQNAASLTTSGLDFQANYTMPFLSGELAWQLVGNYSDEQSLTAFSSPAFDFAGSMSAASQYQGAPKTHFNLSATYQQGSWSATVQTRFIGAATLNNAWTAGVQVDNNYVPPVAYLDLRGSYQWTDNLQLYAAVDNAADTPPPSVPTTLGTKTSLTTVASVYDILGRMYHVGVRAAF
jgi:outer membrane receptor protein involved in Fe transport